MVNKKTIKNVKKQDVKKQEIQENTMKPIPEKVAQSEELVVKSEPTVKKQIDRNTLIPIANFTNGTLIYISKKTGATWELIGFGTTDEMELSELMSMRSSSPKFLGEPWLIVLDDEAVDYLGLTGLYQNIIMPENFDQFLKMNIEQTKAFLEKAPKGMQQLIISKVKELIDKGQFDSIHKKKLIEETFNIDLDS